MTKKLPPRKGRGICKSKILREEILDTTAEKISNRKRKREKTEASSENLRKNVAEKGVLRLVVRAKF